MSFHASIATVPKEERGGYEVRGVKTVDGKRDEDVQDGGRSEFDQVQENGNERCHKDCNNRYGCPRIDLLLKVSSLKFKSTYCISTDQLALLRYLHPGSPRSRANDHVIRDEVATSPMVERKVNARTIAVIAVVPLDELLLWRKIWMKG